jgi:molybdate transport system permease protein
MDVFRITSFTIATAALATLLMLPPGLLLAWLLARGRFRGRVLLETLVSLPLVMPPVATGLVLLMLVAPRGPVGRLLDKVGIEVVFTWKAVVLAMVVMGLPLLVRTVRSGIEQVDRRYEAVAATLGAPPLRVFFTVTLPLARPAVLAGSVLGFARALGEFGATIVFAGNVAGETRTIPVAVYTLLNVRGGEAAVLRLAAVSVALALAALLGSFWLSARQRRP